MQNIRSLIKTGESYLVEHGVPNARRNAEWMLSHALACHNTELYMNADDVPPSDRVEAFESMLERRGKREPLQYVLETTEFMSLRFETRPGVFIPRPDTEVVVETAERLIGAGDANVCDLCCGSGTIAVSLAQRLGAGVVAVDASEQAAALTARNAELNQVDRRVRVINIEALRFLDLHAGVADALPGDRLGPFDAIVSNPPYVSTSDIATLPPEIRDHEPPLSLDGGADGLDFYRAVVPKLAASLNASGVVVFEIGDDQAEAVSSLLRAAGFTAVEVHRDYNGCERAVTARLA